MAGVITHTFVYPIKGLHGILTSLRGVRTDCQLGVVGDRNYAVYRKASGKPESWKPKGLFYVCMNRAGMATPHPLDESDLDDSYRLDPQAAAAILTDRGLLTDDTSLVETGGDWHLCDKNKPYVSFLNLASVRDLEQHTGISIDPRRFRMNVWVDGLDPWVELDHITRHGYGPMQTMQAGHVLLHGDDVCERCNAIEQSPKDGSFDSDLQEQLESCLKARSYPGSPKRGTHRVMGWFGIPQQNDIIKVGDAFSFN